MGGQRREKRPGRPVQCQALFLQVQFVGSAWVSLTVARDDGKKEVCPDAHESTSAYVYQALGSAIDHFVKEV